MDLANRGRHVLGIDDEPVDHAGRGAVCDGGLVGVDEAGDGWGGGGGVDAGLAAVWGGGAGDGGGGAAGEVYREELLHEGSLQSVTSSMVKPRTGSARVLRGGAWDLIVASRFRGAFRSNVGSAYRIIHTGFRCGRTE